MTAHEPGQWQERANMLTAALAKDMRAEPVRTSAQMLLIAAGIVRALGVQEGAAFLDVAATDLLEYDRKEKADAATNQ